MISLTLKLTMLAFISFIVLTAALPLTLENAAIASAHRSRDLDSKLENSYIVKLKDGANATGHINSLPFLFSVEDPNSPVTHWWPEGFRGYSGNFVGTALDAIKASPDVEYVEKNARVRARASQRKAPWNLQAISSRFPVGGTRANRMKYTYKYNLPIGDGVDIYVIDTGVYTGHNEFEGRASFGWAAPGYRREDGDGHGTHVAAIAAGKTYGVAKKANIIAVKTLDDNGDGTADNAIAGINWILGNIMVTRRPSIALLPSTSEKTLLQGLDDAVTTLITNGVPVVISAGNESEDASYSSPASVPLAIVVGASDITDTMAWDSNFGRNLDVFAPGVDITSAWITGPSSTRVETGTSMAAAHVAGIAANWLSIERWLTPVDMSSKLWLLSTKDAIRGVPPNTWNYFVYNGAT